MNAFNFEIGRVPEGWEVADWVHVINGDFAHGPRASIQPMFDDYGWSNRNFGRICAYMFFEDEAPKVRAWVDWFMKEYER
jgi:hypothetical protein